MVYESKGCSVWKIMMKVVVHLWIFAMASPGQNQLVITGKWLHCQSNKLTKSVWIHVWSCKKFLAFICVFFFRSPYVNITFHPKAIWAVSSNISLDSEFSWQLMDLLSIPFFNILTYFKGPFLQWTLMYSLFSGSKTLCYKCVKLWWINMSLQDI